MNEQWKDIIGYEGLYQVSDYGRVKSLHRGQNILKHGVTRGYCKVVLCKGGRCRNHSVHTLVLKVFSSQFPKETVNHINGIKNDNRLINLEWASHRENILHSHRIGLCKIGESHYKAKLNYNDVTIIKSLLREGLPHIQIAKKFKVNISTIQDIYKGRSWKSHGLV